MKNQATFLITLTLFALGLLSSSARAADVTDTANQLPQFETLSRAIQAAGLDGALEGRGSFTLFAPTDAAFDKLPPGTLDELLKPSRKPMLASILKYHIVPKRYSARAIMRLRSGTNLQTLNSENIAVRTGNRVSLDPFVGDQANVVQTDIRARSGVIHAIDEVLIPPSLAYELARNPAFKNENR